MPHMTDEQLRSARDKIVSHYFGHPAVTLIDVGIVDAPDADATDADPKASGSESAGKTGDREQGVQKAEPKQPTAAEIRSARTPAQDTNELLVGIRIHVNDERYAQQHELRDTFPSSVDGVLVKVLYGDYYAQQQR